MSIRIENVEVVGLEPALRGMRNPKNSWHLSDSWYCDEDCPHVMNNTTPADYCRDGLNAFCMGEKDHTLAMRLAKGGPVHAKYRRMIVVYADITCHHTWWAEFDTYKVGTVRNSCSKMHKIHVKGFVKDDFSHEGIDEVSIDHPDVMEEFERLMSRLEWLRVQFNETQEKKYWRAMIELLPMGFNIRATVMMSYEVLANIYRWRDHHKVFEWSDMCRWIETLPYSEIITGKKDE